MHAQVEVVVGGRVHRFWRRLFAGYHLDQREEINRVERVRNNHLFFSTDPIVGFKSSTFSHGRSFNPYRRWRGNRGAEEHLREDVAFFDGESEHEPMLLKAAQLLGLEFVSLLVAMTR